jgi:hypothetical protein
VLFIGAAHRTQLSQLIATVGSRPVLVVTDAPDGLDQGAMINFQLADDRLRFEVSVPASQRAGLSLSSRLLAAAMRVEMTGCFMECRHLEHVSWPAWAMLDLRPAIYRS